MHPAIERKRNSSPWPGRPLRQPPTSVRPISGAGSSKRTHGAGLVGRPATDLDKTLSGADLRTRWGNV
jgi:hypothetical protein